MTIRVLSHISMTEEDFGILDDIERDAAVKLSQDAANFDLPIRVQFIDSDGRIEEWNLRS